MTRQERLVLGADALKSLELAGYADMTFLILSYIEWNNAYGVAGNQIFITLCVIQCKCKDSVQTLKHTDKILLAASGTHSITIKRQDNLAVTAGTERVSALILTTYCLMVVYLTVYGQHLQTILAEKGLTARLRVHNTQTLVSQYGRASTPDSAPVRTAVTNPATHFQCLLSELL
jgi:hypothetical protein